MIPYGKQDIRDEDIHAVIETLKSDFLTQGPKVKEFETDFANFIGARYAVAVNNGTAALHLSSLALGVTSNSRVITSPITFAASANCIRYCGGEVFFVDINEETLTLDIEKVRTLIESYPKGYFSGIIPVDFGGFPVNMEEFQSLASEHGLWLLEDACHAPGAFFVDTKGKRQNCGNGLFADLSVFSFHPVKHIACGEGGMITTNSEILFNKLLSLRTHGITRDPKLLLENHGGWYYEMQELGYNYRISDINAALGVSQLKRLEENINRRKEIAKRYEQAFENNNNIKLIPFTNRNSYHLYIIQVPNRLELYNYLKSVGIFSQVHYIPVHLLPYYQSLGWKKGDCIISEQYYENCLSLPMFHSLEVEEQEYVITKVLNFFQ